MFRDLVHSKATGVDNRTTRSWPWPATQGQGHINEVKATAFSVKSRAFEAKAKQLASMPRPDISNFQLIFVFHMCSVHNIHFSCD